MARNSSTIEAPAILRRPGDDRPVAKGADLTVLNAVRQYKQEAKRARWTRTLKNRGNLRIFLGEQDYSYKQRGQSKEFLPKLPMAIEQFASAIKRALTDFGDWYRVEVPPDAPLTGEVIRSLMSVYLKKLSDGYMTIPFPIVISDAMKLGAINSLIITKVHGAPVTGNRFVVEKSLEGFQMNGQTFPRVKHDLKRMEVTNWQPWIDLIRDEDYYPDPRGHMLYEIQEIETDLGHLVEWADAGIYDKDAVKRIEEDFQNIEQEIIKIRYVGQDIAPVPSFRKRAILHELWGTILGENGRIVKKNCVATIANDKYLIRPPTDNPWWHGRSPFVVCPLLRVPHSVWHKALADHGSALNIAMNELFNLMLDGGLASVWGVKQVHTDWLEDPRQISDGIAQGMTLAVNDRCPPQGKAVELVATGQIPQDALALFNISDREFNAGMMTNDTKFGMVAPKQVKACVPLYSEALTREGWKLPGALRVGDDILAFNKDTGLCEWTPILDLYFHPGAETVLYVNGTKGFKAICTPNHKWVSCQRSRLSEPTRWALAPIDEVGRQRELLQSAPAPDGKGLGQLSVHELLSRDTLPEQVLRMTSVERQAFIVGLLAGEGTLNKSTNANRASINMAQNPGPVLEAFRLACTLEGIATTEWHYLYMGKTQTHDGRMYWPTVRSVSLLQRPRRRLTTFRRYEVGVQPVWCPQTHLKTWVMRQGTTITITGNTEVVAAEQGNASMLDGIIRDVEDLAIAPILHMMFLNLLQFADDLDSDDVIGAIGTKAAVVLARLSPAERFAAFHGAKFQVYGLSAVRARARDFQKLAALLQMVGSNPLMMQAFVKDYSLSATLAQMLKTLNIDPATLRMTDEERAGLPAMLQQLPMFSQLVNGPGAQGQTQGGAGLSAQGVGEPGLPAEINQQRTNALSAAGI